MITFLDFDAPFHDPEVYRIDGTSLTRKWGGL
jgi:hypothetical protein